MRMKLQPYDPRLGETYKDKQGVEKPRFPMRWGQGFFHYRLMGLEKDGSEVRQFAWENNTRLLLCVGDSGPTLLWKEFLKPDKYARVGFCSGKREIEKRKLICIAS